MRTLYSCSKGAAYVLPFLYSSPRPPPPSPLSSSSPHPLYGLLAQCHGQITKKLLGCKIDSKRNSFPLFFSTGSLFLSYLFGSLSPFHSCSDQTSIFSRGNFKPHASLGKSLFEFKYWKVANFMPHRWKLQYFLHLAECTFVQWAIRSVP